MNLQVDVRNPNKFPVYCEFSPWKVSFPPPPQFHPLFSVRTKKKLLSLKFQKYKKVQKSRKQNSKEIFP